MFENNYLIYRYKQLFITILIVLMSVITTHAFYRKTLCETYKNHSELYLHLLRFKTIQGHSLGFQ